MFFLLHKEQAPAKQQQAIEAYWKQREAELGDMPQFQKEILIRKEKQDVASGKRQLPPSVLNAGASAAPDSKAKPPGPVNGVVLPPPPPPTPTPLSQLKANAASASAKHVTAPTGAVVLPPPPPVK